MQANQNKNSRIHAFAFRSEVKNVNFIAYVNFGCLPPIGDFNFAAEIKTTTPIEVIKSWPVEEQEQLYYECNKWVQAVGEQLQVILEEYLNED